VGPECPSHGLVDDHNARSGLRVAFIEIAPLQQPDSHGPKVVGADVAEYSDLLFCLFRREHGLSLKLEAIPIIKPYQRNSSSCRGGGFDLGHLFNMLLHPLNKTNRLGV
jgi:hypothetical protein